MHPALLDAALQLVDCLVGSVAGASWLVQHIESVEVWVSERTASLSHSTSSAATLWAHCQVLSSSSREASVDCRVIDVADGRLLALLRGVHFVSQVQPLPALGLYRVDWVATKEEGIVTDAAPHRERTAIRLVEFDSNQSPKSAFMEALAGTFPGLERLVVR